MPRFKSKGCIGEWILGKKRACTPTGLFGFKLKPESLMVFIADASRARHKIIGGLSQPRKNIANDRLCPKRLAFPKIQNSSKKNIFL
jgi:hypothetical protein